MDISPLSMQRPLSGGVLEDAQLRAKAQELEAAFLAEMLAYTGLEPQEGSFAGGIGEAQFSSFLRQEQARLLVEKGGVGLAEKFFTALKGQQDVK